ncbi:MAG: 50S ribosomal protein L4 [Deltaproteobacteria bacterium]|nr:50S ribosomal protein L4 [Deltaproteobacteria bacterium]
MISCNVYNLNREKVSEADLREDIFGVPVKKHVLHQVVLAQLAARRSGCASTKGRSSVKASGAKLWRQKGTGRARVGDAAAPIRKGGGVAFGPKQRKYNHRVSKKTRKVALRMALTDKVASGKLVIVKDFNEFLELKTKKFVELLKRFELSKALIVTHDKEDILEKSSRNVQDAKVVRHQGLNVYDILKYNVLMLEESVLKDIGEALS